MPNLKEEFPEFYQEKLKDLDFNISFNNIIVFDTNFLLDIIQLPTQIAKEYLEAMKKVKEIIYIPYLVALEFNFQKSSIKKGKQYNIQKYKDNINGSIDNIKTKINELDLLNIKDNKEDFSDELLSEIDSFSNKLSEIINQKIKENITEEENSVYKDLIELINDKIGEKYEQSWIDQVEEEGEGRYEKQIPPGYNDKTKEDESEETRHYSNLYYQRKYGDLIIWKDIINYAKNNSSRGKKVIFVTNDGQSKKKKDLLYKVKDLVVGPKIYLMNELHMEAKKELYIVSNLRFVQIINNLSEEQFKKLESATEKKFKLYAPEDKREIILKMIKEANISNTSNKYGLTDDGYLYKITSDDTPQKYDHLDINSFNAITKRKLRNQLIHEYFSATDSDSEKDISENTLINNYIESLIKYKNTYDSDENNE